jgi:D-psicose/D-tagatose/L-ribulose 3-epimerase
MRIAVSNLGWEPRQDEAVASLLRAHAIDAIDVAPGRYFADPSRAAPADLSAVRAAWEHRGVEITGMQALLFGTTGLNVFGPAPIQEAMLEHLDGVCTTAAGLGATRLTFGSPRNRDASGWTDEAARRHAVEFFARLGGIAARHGVHICLEPNPPRYGCNFMMTTDDAAVAHGGIRLQLDTGALAENREDAGELIPRHAALIGHIHASEPGLGPLGSAGTDHASYGALIRAHAPDRIVAIEMLPAAAPLEAIDRSLHLATRHYRNFVEVGS